jgi:hypothetical protein
MTHVYSINDPNLKMETSFNDCKIQTFSSKAENVNFKNWFKDTTDLRTMFSSTQRKFLL